MTCQGITKEGKPCVYKGKYDGYCGFHKNQRSNSEEPMEKPIVENEIKQACEGPIVENEIKQACKVEGSIVENEIKQACKVEGPIVENDIKQACKVEGCTYPRYEESLKGEFCLSHNHQYRFECYKECPICMDDLDDSSETPLVCGHWFHNECLMKCEQAICPICREPHNLVMPQRVSPPISLSEFTRPFPPLRPNPAIREAIERLRAALSNVNIELNRSRELLTSYQR